jgi:hypothetical protein
VHAGSVQRFSIGDAAELAGDVGSDQRLIGVLIELDAAVPWRGCGTRSPRWCAHDRF